MFLVRIPISIALGLLARKGAEQVTSTLLARVDGVPGNERPEARNLEVKLRYVLLAATIEAVAFTLTRVLADRGAQRVTLALTGASAPRSKA